MRYAFMSFSCPEASLDEMLSIARRFGYDGIEPRVTPNHHHGVSLGNSAGKRREIRKKVQDSGIVLCCLAAGCRYSDPRETQAQVEETRAYIDLAADIGAVRLRVFGGNIPDGVTRDDATEILVGALRTLGDHAAARGVTVCMETHDLKGWCDPVHVAEVMRRVNHPAIGVNWDVLHPVAVAGRTMDEAFASLRPWIRHVHFHDGAKENGKTVWKPIGKGIADHRKVVKLLQSIPFTGYLSGEWIDWDPYDVVLPRELAVMMGYEVS